MVTMHVQEFYLWGKAELEDLLYLPKNDHLLFAYFGISLHVRRRSLRTSVNALLTIKRRLVKVLGDIRANHYNSVLIRDPRSTEYPDIGNVDDFRKRPLWRYWRFEGHQPVDHVAFVVKQCFAYADFEKEDWDALLDYSDDPGHPRLYGIPDDFHWKDEKGRKYHVFWYGKIPETNRAWYKVIRVIPFARIIAIDDIGDFYNEPPHLLVEYRPDADPFEPSSYHWIEGFGMFRRGFNPDKDKRVKFFPEDIPDPTPPEEA